MRDREREERSRWLPSRRQLMVGGGALALLGAGTAPAKQPVYIADMHYHLFFVGRRPAHTQQLAANMARGQATLVSWSLVGDQPWLALTGAGIKPKGAPAKGQASAWLKEEMARVRKYLSAEGLPVVTKPDDVARAVAGKPHIVLSVEGATFADDGEAEVQAAYDLGIRHIQLVHFIANRIGDVQTLPASHGGLSSYGRQVVEACNRLGILIDLAHCAERTVDQVLELSKAPVVWSHSSVQGWRAVLPYAPTFAVRQLSIGAARRIAAKGGVIGLWALGADVGTTVESYTERILDLADRLGDRHVAFGTDMNALANPAIASFADLRRVVDLMEAKGRPAQTVRRIAIENYSRVLTIAMGGAPADR